MTQYSGSLSPLYHGMLLALQQVLIAYCDHAATDKGQSLTEITTRPCDLYKALLLTGSWAGRAPKV